MEPSPPAPQETFVSSLDIVVSDGEDSAAAPDGELIYDVQPTSNGRMSGHTQGRMSARASKTNALVALAHVNAEMAKALAQDPTNPQLQQQAQGPSNGANPARNPIRQSMKIPRAPPLDFSTIRTFAPRFPNPMPRPKHRPNRIFGLQPAPVYHPTIEEFADPMKYIEKIAPEAKEYGICKVVPPEGWRPPFALNTETFRFKTRLQQLNSMEASARASLNFLEQLYLFHRQQGSHSLSVPTVAGRPLDMWRLNREVRNHGGYVKVTNDRKWSAIARTLGYNLAANTTICSQIKAAYFKVILPFEDYVKKAKKNGKSKAVAYDSFQKTEDDESSEPARTAVQKKVENAKAVQEGKLPSNKIASSLPGGVDQRDEALSELLPGEVCEICTFDHNPERIVLCDGCDRGYHLDCLNPKLPEVPTSQFFCDNCLFFNGADYGFEEGESHSLYSFRRRADAFKRKWLQDHPLSVDRAQTRHEGAPTTPEDEIEEQVTIEDHFEREFWRLVESPHETVEIEYGADVNSTKEACGFPDLEVHSNDPYSRDGWNLNNLPILAGSLLRYIRSDISGMTIPWIYVGMVFSTFAWHKEDHYTYSINYHHWGDTKTWYGVPGNDDEILESAMKEAAPELFEQQPDLLFQLVTLMSPGRLKRHGCRVYCADQRPNEFVITFPRAYHSGFNHGFNFNEAVNFALPDWIPNGLRCVNRYREIKKNPVFSHDELLVTIATWDKNAHTAHWMLPHWKEMVERELAGRQKCRRFLPKTKEIVDPTDINEEDYQCVHCRTLAFLGRITDKEGREVTCWDCWNTLPEGIEIVFQLKYNDKELKAMLDKVKTRAQKAVIGDVKPSQEPEGDSVDRKRKLSDADGVEAQRVKMDQTAGTSNGAPLAAEASPAPSAAHSLHPTEKQVSWHAGVHTEVPDQLRTTAWA